MTEAYRGVLPLTFIHGHYHFLVDDMIRRPINHTNMQISDRHEWTHVLGLDCDNSYKALGCYDTEVKEAVAWDIRKDYNTYVTMV